MVSKEFLKNSFLYSRCWLLKSKNSARQILCFHCFTKKYCRAISVCDATDDLFSQCKASFVPRILFLRVGLPES